MGTTNNVLVIGYDDSQEKDVTVLTVAEVGVDGKFKLIKSFMGPDAEGMYKLLKGENENETR